jgi:diacylglycerol kinase family enzyme
LGLDSEVLRIVDRTKLVKGPIVYPVSTLRALRSWKPASFVVTVDGKSHDLSGHNVVVANTPWYGGGMRMAPNADAGDGCLSVVVIGNLPKWRLLWHSPKVFSGTHVSLPEVRTFSGKHISIASNRNFSVFADGERVGSTPVDIDVVPGALRMIVPVS